MQAAVILTAATVTLALDNVASTGTFECEADHQCESGYCYSDTGYCAPCLDCSQFQRQAPQWRSCAHDPQECGSCLPGFEYVYLADGKERSFCVHQKSAASNSIWSERSPCLWSIIACGGLVLLILVVVIFRTRRAFKTRSSVQNSNPDVEDPPPLSIDNENENPPPSYDSSIPLLHQNLGVSPALVTSLMVIEKDNGNLQQAVPFSNAYPPYGDGGLSVADADDEGQDIPDFDAGEMGLPGSPLMNVDGEAHRGPSPPMLEDEDTMPSDWIPDVCSFRQSATTSVVPSPQPEPSLSDEHSSITSSLSDISNVDVAVAVDIITNAQVLNDSGVSASCSQQSDLSSTHDVGTCNHALASGQSTAANPMQTVLERCRSDDDVSTLAEIRASKRQRRDSGSSSMKSIEPY